MTVYPTFPGMTRAKWPSPMEGIWQTLPMAEGGLSRWKRPDLGLSDRLFIGGILNLPVEKRPWGVVQWLAEVYQTSRPTLYAIGAQTKAGLLRPMPQATRREAPKAAAWVRDDAKTVRVTHNRVYRTALTLLFPGGVSERSSADCLQAAFDLDRSSAFLSALLHEAGQRAGRILQEVDHTPWGLCCKPAMRCLSVAIRSCGWSSRAA